MSEARSRYWLRGGRLINKLTYLSLFHTYTKFITQDQPYFGIFGKNGNTKTSDHCLDGASMARLRNRLSIPPALPWPYTSEHPDPVRAEVSMSIEDTSASHSESQAVIDEDFRRSSSNSDKTHSPEQTQLPTRAEIITNGLAHSGGNVSVVLKAPNPSGPSFFRLILPGEVICNSLNRSKRKLDAMSFILQVLSGKLYN
ncbi:uncharacterized protein EAF01_004019 [Botrytis porri]|uniref:Uncharacterized protein n=1 Tax=Botrytis porri TaxID=87229 RepID=A0A4Z1K7G3_9HELO|nr:uncharacterized protein EAF01_004019 [Botrytis porri]KAF7908264.1 hypothetical protein EAF01_004019 [Botrytis porri]TGO81386.1 hypothetical protein BPOR_1178g00030 [Botrytis porri]